MAIKDLTYDQWVNLGARKWRGSASPFFSRAYAGYTKKQIALIARELQGTQKTVFDPMAGQAFAISTLTWLGHNVNVNDHNLALVLLAWLRSRQTLSNIHHFATQFRIWSDPIEKEIAQCAINRNEKLNFCQNWISQSVDEQLNIYLSHFKNRIVPEVLLRDPEKHAEKLFRLAVVVLSARRIALFSQSDNATWLKPGGVERNINIVQEIRREIDNLIEWIKQLEEIYGHDIFSRSDSRIGLHSVNISQSLVSLAEEAEIGVCSPPYANRLDYSAMWAPELHVLARLTTEADPKIVKESQIATTMKRSKFDTQPSSNQLPESVQRSLIEIQQSDEYASSSYYYPYFKQFSDDLLAAMNNFILSASSADTWLIFIRDTARKDTLIESHKICEAVLVNSGFEPTSEISLGIVRSHVGLTRRNYSSPTLHGFAQREWVLRFKRTGVDNAR